MSELSDIIDALKPVSTATITTVLLKHGLRRVWMRGTRPIRPGSRALLGARSPCASFPRVRIWRRRLRGPHLARRERRSRRCRPAASRWPTRWASRMPASSATSSARGSSSAASLALSPTGLCATWRASSRPASPSGARAQPPLPRSPRSPSSIGRSQSGAAASPSIPTISFVVDDDGAVLIPAALVEDVVRVAPEQERMETWIMDEVSNGAKLPGLYPPNEENLKRYKDWASRR